MKTKKLKRLSVIVALAAVFTCSCSTGGSPNNNEPDATTAVSETEKEPLETNEETTSETQEEIQISKPEITFKEVDFDSFPSGKYVKAFREGNYRIRIHMDKDEDSHQTLNFNDGRLHIFMDTDGVQYEMIYMDKMMYNLYDNKCYAEPNPVDVSMINIFGFLDYSGSGTDEFNGKQCRYDEFDDLMGGVKCRIYLDDDDNMLAFTESERTIIIEDYTDSFSTDGLYKIPEDSAQLSYNEFSKLMMKAFSEAAAADSKESVISEPENSSSEKAAETE